MPPPAQHRFIEERIEPLSDEADVIVLAGDIAKAVDGGLQRALTRICGFGVPVVFVSGNHEYYGVRPRLVTKILDEAGAQIENFTWLNCKVKDIAGLRFIGGTLWFPQPNAKTLAAGKRFLNDFNYIRDLEPWVYQEHARCQAILNAFLKPGPSSSPGADVVVTHHMPSWACTSPRYRGSSIDHFFTCDQGELLKNCGVPLWVFGHTHDRSVKRVGDTMLVCNALGYPHEQEVPERGKYLEKCLIRVKAANGQVTFPNGEPGGGW